jgi:hypothetical protein
VGECVGVFEFVFEGGTRARLACLVLGTNTFASHGLENADAGRRSPAVSIVRGAVFH